MVLLPEGAIKLGLAVRKHLHGAHERVDSSSEFPSFIFWVREQKTG